MKIEFSFKQAGVIPFRKNQGRLEILLITSRNKKRWIIPKGGIEPHQTAEQAAKQEAFEEAGVLGDLVAKLGSVNDEKTIGSFEIIIFALEVTEYLENFLEKNIRERKWFLIHDAIENVGNYDVALEIKKLPEALKKLNFL